MKRTLLAWAACCAALGGAPAAAQESWPTRPVTMVVPFPPGVWRIPSPARWPNP